MSDETVDKLMAMCDTLDNFSKFMGNLSQTSKKHKMRLNEIHTFDVLDQSSLKELAESWVRGS